MDPKVTQKLEEDVSFVRQAVEQREEGQYSTLGITVLWAVIIAVGYTLNDFAAEYSPLFWSIAPLAGFLVSCGLGAWGENRESAGRDWGGDMLCTGAPSFSQEWL